MGYVKAILYSITKNFKWKGYFEDLENVYISPHDRYGEGEWKIFEMINSDNIKPREPILIYSR